MLKGPSSGQQSSPYMGPVTTARSALCGPPHPEELGSCSASFQGRHRGREAGAQWRLGGFEHSQELTALRVLHTINASVHDVRGARNRLRFLADMRNAALRPMHARGAKRYDKLIFLNDVYGCALTTPPSWPEPSSPAHDGSCVVLLLLLLSIPPGCFPRPGGAVEPLGLLFSQRPGCCCEASSALRG